MNAAPRKKRNLTTRTTTLTKSGGAETGTKDSAKKCAALILLAGGSSQRMGALGKKECMPLDGGTVLSAAASVFLKTDLFSHIIVTYNNAGDKKAAAANKAAVRAALFKDDAVRLAAEKAAVKVKFASGGQSRQESVLKALKALKAAGFEKGIVLIHDGARPFLTKTLVKKTFSAAKKDGAAVPALQPVETQKEIDSSGKIARHLLRKSLASVQTPQAFRFPEILEFHKKAARENFSCTDDTEIWDSYSAQKTRVIKGESTNIKITYPKDIAEKGRLESAAPKEGRIFRIGLGTDLHRLVGGRRLVLGGIVIPFSKGEDAHSDGDALLHAVTDALLGAAALGDIGSYFPPEEKKWKDADSKMLLKKCWNDVRKKGFVLENLDCVIKIQSPKFLPYRDSVRGCIAEILGVSKERVFVKAKTGEHMGPVGLGEAVETEAVCLLSREIH